MRYTWAILLLLAASSLVAQKGKTYVMRVRAPVAKCDIQFNEANFLLEKESVVRIKVMGRNPRITVQVKGGRVVSQNGENYKLRFTTPGTVVISVFQLSDGGSKLLATRKASVIAPTFFFCGLAVDSFTKVLRLGACQLYAYSEFYRQNLPVKKFHMLFYDEELVNGKWKEKIDTLQSDTCRLTAEMRKRLNQFQPKTNKMYLYNLVCGLPDGSIRVLEPVELLGLRDSTAMSARPQCIFNLRRKKL